MGLRFVQIPDRIISDVESGSLIPNDILTYSYLLRQTSEAGGRFLLKSEAEMANEIIINGKPCSLSKVTKSLKRLRDSGHIERQYSSRCSKTIIKTKVSQRES